LQSLDPSFSNPAGSSAFFGLLDLAPGVLDPQVMINFQISPTKDEMFLQKEVMEPKNKEMSLILHCRIMMEQSE
jgi:hypothetical protein